MTASHKDFVVETFRPAYLEPKVKAGLPTRVDIARKSLEECRVCPRRCNVDRLRGETKVCHTGRHARVISAFPHHGEEDCLRGTAGSGTIFFARCNLRCVFCQNADISQTDAGRECTPSQIAELMLGLQARGCHNINFVTPEHVVPQVIEAIVEAVDAGLHLPIVYNTSAYDSLESLQQLEGLIDIYMPDFKLFSTEACSRYLGAKDYGEAARAAIREMHRQVGDLHVTADGIACRGLLVRHLVMPGLADESEHVLRWLAEEISTDTFVNIMAQYRPSFLVGEPDADDATRFPEIDRPLTRAELDHAFEVARTAGLWRFD